MNKFHPRNHNPIEILKEDMPKLADAAKFFAAVLLLIALSLGFVAIWLFEADEIGGLIR